MRLYLKLLAELVKFRTVSFDRKFIPEINKALSWYAKLFKQFGFTVKIIPGYDNPIILAEFIQDTSLKTCLIYGHYDVQPAEKSDGWDSDPWTLSARDGRLFARGVTDNKGQHLIHLVSVFELLKQQKLKYNIKIFIEGNEETGSPNIGKFFRDFRQALKADFVLVSDGEMIAGMPNINAGYRGITNCTLTVKTAATDLHSGIYGGFAPNPVHELSKLIAEMYDKDWHLCIPHFYDDVLPIDPQIAQMNRKIPFSRETFSKNTGAKAVIKEKKFDYYSQLSLMPTVQVSGISSGYTGNGFKSIIPGKAIAKFNFRLVEVQKPAKILQLFKEFLQKSLPEYVSFKLEVPAGSEGSVPAVKIDLNNEYVTFARKTLKQVYGAEPLITHHGATLPMMSELKSILKIPVLDIPLVNEDCAMHGANENYQLELVEKALVFSRKLMQKT